MSGGGRGGGGGSGRGGGGGGREGGGGGYRLSANTSIPCYLCVAVSLTASKAFRVGASPPLAPTGHCQHGRQKHHCRDCR
jgi:hypothetical protein